MKIGEAFELLKLSADADAETVEDALEQAVFDIKHELLRMEIVPRVFLARITKLHRLHEAECLILEEEMDVDFSVKSMGFPSAQEALARFEFTSSSNVESWIRAFETRWVIAKQNMAAAHTPKALATAIRALALCQYDFESVLKAYLLNHIESSDLDSSKQSDQLGSAKLLSIIRAAQMNDKPLRDIVRENWTRLSKEDYIALQKEKARVLKSEALAK